MDSTGEENSPIRFPSDRIPTLSDLSEDKVNKKKMNEPQEKPNKAPNLRQPPNMTNNLRNNKPYVVYDDLSNTNKLSNKNESLTYCLISVLISFTFGLAIGVIIMSSSAPENISRIDVEPILTRNLNSVKSDVKTDEFSAVSFTGHKYNKDITKIYPKGLTEVMKDILKDTKSDRRHTIRINKTFTPNDDTVLYGNIFWGPEIENSMPQGYGANSAEVWEAYVNDTEIIKMESGCGRMQNRLVTFRDGLQACVRYRQNTDQIQGEIFSFYVGRLLNLTNLAPSVVKIVDIKDKLWRNVANDIATAQWSSNRAVVLTQYIPSLESATIPDVFRPTTRHLNKIDVLKMSLMENSTNELKKQTLLDKLKSKNVKSKQTTENFDHIDMKLTKKTIDRFLELAQWSDLIIFDYLTANLDRIVNNLFNFQWNVNIMDGPAHNLARKMDSGLLLFLDNESGLLHGYRLLKKYNVYHSLMLDNLCVFRRRTIDALKSLHERSIGSLLSEMFHKKNSIIIRDILPSLPEKNAKILHERIGKVLSQVEKCEMSFR